MEIQRKALPLVFRLSRSLKVTGNDTDPSATCGFLLVIHSHHGRRVLYRFWSKQRF